MNPDREKLVVAYVRVSTAEQEKNGYGISIQRRDVKAFAKTYNLNLGRIYADKAETGVIEDRHVLQKLLKDCEHGLISTVIIPNIDRFSRDVRIAENLFWTLDRMGVTVRIADMPHYDGKNRKDVLIRQIREAIAEDDRKEIIERLWKGRRERVRSGKPAGGTVPYGYRRRQGTFVAHPMESEIVRMIFAMTGEKSISEIARQLNARGFRRRNGKDWDGRAVLAITQRRGLYERGVLRYGSVTATNERLVLVRGRAEKRPKPGRVSL